ncbi:MAG: hypothetical protein RIQ71_761 [Verrucomicrobiota bacterium]|jgi:hypothetical protein
MVIDGEDAFPDFANPEWVKRMLAKAEKRAALRTKRKKNQQPGEQNDTNVPQLLDFIHVLIPAGPAGPAGRCFYRKKVCGRLSQPSLPPQPKSMMARGHWYDTSPLRPAGHTAKILTPSGGGV